MIFGAASASEVCVDASGRYSVCDVEMRRVKGVDDRRREHDCRARRQLGFADDRTSMKRKREEVLCMMMIGFIYEFFLER